MKMFTNFAGWLIFLDECIWREQFYEWKLSKTYVSSELTHDDGRDIWVDSETLNYMSLARGFALTCAWESS